MQKTSLLPAEYQQIEWIGARKSQYIVTDIPVQSPISLEYKVKYIQSIGIDDFAMFCTGYRISGSSYYIRIGSGKYGGQYQGYYSNYYTEGNNLLIHGTEYLIKANLKEGLQEQWVNGNKLTDRTYTNNASILPIDQSKITFYIFAEGRLLADGTTNVLFKSNANLYDLKVSNDVGLIGHFIPCIRISDNEPGMYDTVSGTFYTNAGTGSFVIPS